MAKEEGGPSAAAPLVVVERAPVGGPLGAAEPVLPLAVGAPPVAGSGGAAAFPVGAALPDEGTTGVPADGAPVKNDEVSVPGRGAVV
ncbi:hypothetical protein, partial [Micromonospora arida]